jgi:hypothetical protein
VDLLAIAGVAAALGPVVVHDSRENSALGSVGARPGTFAAAPVVYEQRVGDWRQWWLAFPRNDQDRGIVRTGRHAGECDGPESAMLIGGAAILALGVVAVRRRRSSRDAEHPEP